MPITAETPVQHMPLKDSSGNTFWIKRDDLLPFSFGGNKVRIAKAFMDDCDAKGCDAIIMYGDRRSNLCRVLGAMCSSSGRECVMIATSENEDGNPVPFNERIIKSLGIKVIETEKNKIPEAVDRAFEILRKKGKKPYYIYGNRFGEGNEAAAVSAYAEASGEILDWQERSGITVDYVFTACGTGSTLAGLAVGLTEAGSDAKIVGISISSRSPHRAEECVNRAVRAWYQAEGREVPQRLYDHLCVETKYNCGGYGISNDRVENLITKVFESTSIPLDHTYTGKAMLGMLDYLKEHDVKKKNVLLLHTGGLPLFFDDMVLAAER